MPSWILLGGVPGNSAEDPLSVDSVDTTHTHTLPVMTFRLYLDWVRYGTLLSRQLRHSSVRVAKEGKKETELIWGFLSGVHTHTAALRRPQNICRSFWIGFSSFPVARTMLRELRFRFVAQRLCGRKWAHRPAERGKGGRQGPGEPGSSQGMDKPDRWVLRVVFPLLAPLSADPRGKFPGLATRRRQTIAAWMLFSNGTRRHRHARRRQGGHAKLRDH